MTKAANAKSYMQTIPVMVEANMGSRSSNNNNNNNKTIRQKSAVPVNKEVENILYIKDAITPSSLSTPTSSTPDSSNLDTIFSK